MEPTREELTAALLRVAQGMTLIFIGLLAWLFLWSGMIEIPSLSRFGTPVSTIPAVLWIVGAWHTYRVPALTPAWKKVCGLFLIATTLQLYLIPYIGWWHDVMPAAYRYFNIALFLLSAVGGLLLINSIALQVARRLEDRVLRAEAHLSLISTALVSVFLIGLLQWSMRRMGDEALRWWDIAGLLYTSSSLTRTSIGLTILLPLLPTIAISWEIRQRILAWIPAQGFPEEEA